MRPVSSFGSLSSAIHAAILQLSGREKGSSLNSAFLTPKPLASSVYVHILEAPSPLRRSISVMSPSLPVMSLFPTPLHMDAPGEPGASWNIAWLTTTRRGCYDIFFDGGRPMMIGFVAALTVSVPGSYTIV